MELNEAIKALKWKVVYAKDIGESYTDYVNIEALDTIIKTLEGRPQGDSISREALKEILSDPLYRSSIKDYGEILKYTFVMDIIDNAPPVSDRYDEGYAQGYVDGSTGADWREIK